MRLRDVRIGEQLAYQLLQFLRRYRADVSQLKRLATKDGAIGPYIEAMEQGDRLDAERLIEAIEEALERRE
jgi:hypothetical protein